MKAAELRTRPVSELKEELMELLRKQFNLRMQRGSGQLTKPGDMKQVRRDIARIKTVMRELDAGKDK